jgi:predicted metal-dependent peptidase
MSGYTLKRGDKYRRARLQITRNDKCIMERAHFLAMGREEMTEGTAETDGRTLYANVDWLEQWSVDQIVGLILHEVRHRMLKHTIRFKPAADKARSLHGAVSMDDLHKFWNVACDLRVNRDLADEGWSLPDKGTFDHDGKYRGWSVERIFFSLLNDAEKKQMPEWGTMSEPDGNQGKGNGGSGEDDDRALAQEIDQLNDTGLAMARKRGLVPSSLKELVKETKHEPPWEHRLASTISRLKGGDDFTMARLSNMGRRARMVLPGIVGFQLEHVVIGVDTSGSIGARELSLFLSKINAIVRAERPERLTLIQCDAQIQDVRDLAQDETLPTLAVKGRGGTAFQPLFDHVHRNGLNPEFIIYLTDGDGDRPRDPGIPVVWITTGRDPAPFGDIIRINR